MMTLKEVDNIAYMNHKEWESVWLTGKTDWYPDSLGDLHHTPKASVRLDALRENGEQYTVHVDYGVHAFRIGFVHEFANDIKGASPPS